MKRSTERGVAVLAVGILAIGCAQPDGSGDGEASSNEGGTGTGTSDGTSESGPGGDLPPADPEPCEGIAGPVEPIENLPDAHGWQPSDGPECPGEPPEVVPPCWEGVCFDSVLCTACSQLVVESLDGSLGLSVRVQGEHRVVDRFSPAQGAWSRLVAGAALESGQDRVSFGRSWIAVVHSLFAPERRELRLVDSASGHLASVRAFPGGSITPLFALEDSDNLVFIETVEAGPTFAAVCSTGLDAWAPVEITRVEPVWEAWNLGPFLVDGWIYWANERVHLQSSEIQVLFERELDWRPLGATLIDDVLWFLNASPCDDGDGGCVPGDGGLYLVDTAGPASDYPERVSGVVVVAHQPTFSWLETDGTRLYWQRPDPAQVFPPPAEFVAFDPQTEQLEVLFEFPPGDELTSYRVVGEHLYGVRKQAPGCLERLSLVP